MIKRIFLQFLTKKQNKIKLQITISNITITSVNSTKFLGLVIDSALSWRDHITEVTSKLNKPCYTIKKKLRGLSPRANYTDRAAAAGRRS